VLFPRVHLHKLPPDLCHTIELAIERQGVGELDKSVDDAPVLAAGLRAYHDWHVGEPDHNSDGAGAGDADSGVKPDEGIHLERRLLAEDKVEEAGQVGKPDHDARERVEDTDDGAARVEKHDEAVCEPDDPLPLELPQVQPPDPAGGGVEEGDRPAVDRADAGALAERDPAARVEAAVGECGVPRARGGRAPVRAHSAGDDVLGHVLV